MENLCEDKGGAVDCGDGAPLIEDCVFIGNTGGIGGAICAEGAAVIKNCVLINNSVDHTEYKGHGGGIAILGAKTAQVINCTVFDCASMNKGGAVYLGKEANASFLNCTFSFNHADNGSGFFLEENSQVVMRNSILCFGDAGAAVDGVGTMDVHYSDVYGNQGGDFTGPIANGMGINNNISADPLFIGPKEGDLHLSFYSPCRDAGDSNVSGLPLTDLEKDPRINHTCADMGADEFHTHLYCSRDATPNGEMIVRVIGTPKLAVHLCLGMGFQNPPLKTVFGDWYLTSVFPPMGLGTISWKGVNSLKVRIPVNYPTPSDLYLQAFVRGELTNYWMMNIR